MTELIGEIFSKIFNDNVILATIFVSMVPIMELKGGIPFGMSDAFWGANALSRWQALWSAYLGCSIVVVCLYFAFLPIMKLLRKTKMFKGLANFIDNRVKKQSSKYAQTDLQNSNLDKNEEGDTNPTHDNLQKISTINNATKTKLLKMLGVFAFVAIPLPLTGVWMGVCIAVMLNLNFIETFISVQLGNLIAGIIISTICVIFPQFTHWLIYIFLILVLIVIIYEIIKHKINKNKQKN
ncbi:MAG: small multi-drug export protein [Clostridia bacterium]|nr:small multi-drug export protein [Clostridia bacterium]